MSATRQFQLRRAVWAIAPAYLLLHLLIATCLPDRLSPLSTVGIVVAEITALFACLDTARKVDDFTRTLWLLLGCAILFHAIAMSLDAVNEINKAPVLNYVPAFQVFFSMLFGVPVLVAVSRQNDPRIQKIARVIHAGLSLAIGVVLYVQLFSLLTVRGSSDPHAAELILRLFDGIDLFLASAATIRWLGSGRLRERRFFHILSIFLWINAVLPAIHNRILLRHDFIWLDVLISAPYVILLVLIVAVNQRATQPPPALVRAVRSGSPVFLTLALVFVGMIASRTHFFAGMAVVGLAVAGYAVLNVFTHSRVLETEESLMAMNVDLEKLAAVDDLTGIANRRAFDKVLSHEFAASRRANRPMSLAMVDVDYFKQVNDHSGHPVGDEYLVRIADALRAALPRTVDFIARYGGEEFAVILPATDDAGAAKVVEHLHQSIGSLRLVHPGTISGFVTVSIGFSTSSGSSHESALDLLRAADRALYIAKRRGRDRSEFLSPGAAAL